MKVVIIGGGIAGLTLGIILQKNYIEVVINERLEEMPLRGQAFLMHMEGLSILKDLNPKNKAALLGKTIETFSLRRPSGKEIKHLHLESWKCIKRADLLNFLNDTFSNKMMKKGRDFSHFLYKENKVIAAVFENGEIEYGDIFIGADGSNSRVRELLFDKINFTSVVVKEIVGITRNNHIDENSLTSFIKFQDNTKGLAFGYIPTSDVELVWFMQYDTSVNDISDSTPEELENFCNHNLKDYPQIVKDILKNNDFTTSYIWNTRDADLLSTFHKNNVVLIGDAAHLSLPFTSAGTTNAIIDAKILSETILECPNYEEAFNKYYDMRSKEIEKHINLGRELKNVFLNPQEYTDDHIPVPLIAQKENDELIHINKEIQILYFTDPICSTCWIIQPLLLKLKMEYGDLINIRYCMGGMLPSWDEYTKGKISNPGDAAKYWEEVSIFHEMPLDGDVWIEDPLHSSYPPSIAFKAAQMQDNNLALLFLRRIKEMVFVEKKNIINWKYLEKAAYECGLDTARLLRDFEGKAKDLFTEDLMMGKELGVKSFPTFIFSNKENRKITLTGYHPYEHFENTVLSLAPAAKKENINTNPRNLFTHFPTMAEKEFAFLSNLSKEEALLLLSELHKKGNLEKYESKNGTLWKSLYAVREW